MAQDAKAVMAGLGPAAAAAAQADTAAMAAEATVAVDRR
jgi:hypothetical protein